MRSLPTFSHPGRVLGHVRVFPPAEVTSLDGASEHDPRDAGLGRDDVEAIWDSVVKLYRTGLQPGMSFCLRRRGRVVLDRAIGHLHGNSLDPRPGERLVQATPRSLFNLYSASKCVTAMLVHLLDERGLLHLDDPIAEYIPEFARHGKDAITIRHVLTHRAGIPAVPGAHVDLALLTSPERIIEVLCDARPWTAPGRRLAYHALSGGFLLAEIARRVTGKDVRTLLREEIAEPLGMRSFGYGVAPERVHEVAENVYTGPPALPPGSWMLERSLGVKVPVAVAMSNDPRFLTGVVPSANIITTAEEASRFFQLLLNGGELDGVRIFDRRTVRRAVAETSWLELDGILGLPVRYGMGFMLGSRFFSLYGYDTANAFGHIGFTNVVAWADPDRDVAACLMTSGKPFLAPGQLAWLNVAWTVARRCAKSR